MEIIKSYIKLILLDVFTSISRMVNCVTWIQVTQQIDKIPSFQTDDGEKQLAQPEYVHIYLCELRVYSNQTRVGYCWKSEKTNRGGGDL